MENDLLFEDDEEIDDELPVGEGFLPEADAPPKEGVVAPVKVEVDTNGIGRTIAEALAAQGDRTAGIIRDVAREAMGHIPKPAAATKSKEEVAANNARLQALLMDTTGDVDIEAQIRNLIVPAIDERINGRVNESQSGADNFAVLNGERVVKDFKRELKVNEKLRARYEAEIDKLIPTTSYAWLATLPSQERQQFLEAIDERAYGRLGKASLNDKTPRGQVTGSGGGGGKSPLQQAYNALPKEEQREGQRLAKAFCRAAGLKEGSPEFTKAFNSKLQDYVEG